ncbi:MAG: hypothetical protein ACK5HY_04255 [Parahaliea sp.]
MNKLLFPLVALVGAVMIIWVAAGFLGNHSLVLLITLIIAAAYGMGVHELWRFRQASQGLAAAVARAAPGIDAQSWLEGLDTSLRSAVRASLEGRGGPLPGPVLTPYLVGLLVMLGLLGTFFGMVDTLSGAVGALEGSTELAAIRAGLAAPIAGLGVAFGTSVAGIAASACLGLLSVLSRRERLQVALALDSAGRRAFPEQHLDFHRQQTFEALQAQSAAVPVLVERLDTLVDKLARLGSEISEGLGSSQRQFQEGLSADFRTLLQEVGSSLRESLGDSGRLAGEGIRPAVDSAMAGLASHSEQLHRQIAGALSDQAAQLSSRFSESTAAVQALVEAAQQRQLEAHQVLVERIGEGLATSGRELTALREAETRHQEAVSGQFQSLLEQLQSQSEAATASEAERLSRHDERMQALLEATAGQLGALREAEDQRAEAAQARLAALEGVVAEHLGRLGSELEAPMSRLIETASETPRAAAEVISRLREELASTASESLARDNQLLAEREQLLARLQGLLERLEQSAEAQSEALQSAAGRSAEALGELGARIGVQVDQGLERLSGLATEVAGGAGEVASLGESFGVAVAEFSAANQALLDGLARMEQAIESAGARSDEQLGYYVAQAREIIDHSVLAQKEIIEQLRQVGQQRQLFEAGAGE